MQSSLEEYYNNEYGNYVVPVAFTTPSSSLFLDRSDKCVHIDMREWLRCELHEIKDWIINMPGISNFAKNDHNILFKSSSLLLVFLKVAARSAQLEGHSLHADVVHIKAEDATNSGISPSVSKIIAFMTQWLHEINIDPLEFCLLGAVLYAYPFLPDLELPEAVHGAQENGILNILAYNKLKFRRFSQLCRLLYNLDFVRKFISASPDLMNVVSEWDITSMLGENILKL